MAAELSYFRLSLLSFLSESHPFLIADKTFIKARVDAATTAYEAIIKSGGTHLDAAEIANAELFRHLHFAPFDTLKNILEEEFADEFPTENSREIALLIFPKYEQVMKKYKFSDEFSATPEYEKFYTELTGTVQILLEDGYIQ